MERTLGKLAFFSTLCGFTSGIAVFLLISLTDTTFFSNNASVAIALMVVTGIGVASAFKFKSTLNKLREVM